MTQKEAAAQIDALTEETVKVRTEVVAELKRLRDLLGVDSGVASQDVVDSLGRLSAAVKESDDVIPDAETPPAA